MALIGINSSPKTKMHAHQKPQHHTKPFALIKDA